MRLAALLVSFVVWVCSCAPYALAGEAQDFAKLTASPDGKIAIRAVGEIQDDDFHFDFYEVASGTDLGRIKAADRVSKVAFACRWSPGGSRVAVLMFYGTKNSTLLIFEKGKDGRMSEVPFDIPDAAKAYAAANLKPKLGIAGGDYSGGSLKGLGKWSREDSVKLICGTWIEHFGGKQAPDSGLNLVVPFDAKVAEGKAKVGNVRAHELMSDDAAEAFFKRNGVNTGDDGF